jgi:hypothetical protein
MLGSSWLGVVGPQAAEALTGCCLKRLPEGVERLTLRADDT